MFTAYPTYPRYRALRLMPVPYMRGEDVFALQTGLKDVGNDPGPLDGILGNGTSSAIKAFQKNSFLTIDGIAGPATQSYLVKQIAAAHADENRVPQKLQFGQLSHESAMIVGNYSPQRDDGSYDAGVAQRNTRFTDPKEAFTVPNSIKALAVNTRKYYDQFVGVGSDLRRWGLAAGAWNAPAYASYIAKEEGATKVSSSNTAKPSAAAREALEEYIASATAMMG